MAEAPDSYATSPNKEGTKVTTTNTRYRTYRRGRLAKNKISFSEETSCLKKSSWVICLLSAIFLGERKKNPDRIPTLSAKCKNSGRKHGRKRGRVLAYAEEGGN